MLNHKAVSRERVIGISFVDVLIQAIFILFVLLLVGYIDPDEMKKIKEHQQLGMDMCHKLNKDSAAECREYVHNKTINVQGPDNRALKPSDANFGLVGMNTCRQIGKNDPDECEKEIKKKLGSLIPCLKNDNTVHAKVSTVWDIQSATKIRFIRFDPAYEKYLEEKNYAGRLERVQQIKANVRDGMTYSPKEIEGEFSFIREDDCFHEISVTWSCQCTQNEIGVASAVIRRLKELSR